MGQLKRATEIMLKEPDQFRDFKREVENQLVKGSETDTHFFSEIRTTTSMRDSDLSQRPSYEIADDGLQQSLLVTQGS